jgi:tetratricopeptide (TPR) repeat protein
MWKRISQNLAIEAGDQVLGLRRNRRQGKMEGEPVIDPSAIPEPGSSREFQLRGYSFFTAGDYPQAEGDFEKAVSLDPNDLEALYGLGLTLKMQGRLEESSNAFRKVLGLLKEGSIKDRTRAQMLERLTKGHLNIMAIGDWNLEKEIWKRNE